jgi:glycosyltransferase involved in cell wall biosynthesis
MLVSIIVPVYNMRNHIEKCLDSLLAQTYENIEIICINDCSLDNSLEILQSYKVKYPTKIRVINSIENMKQGGARNLGIDAAIGDYIYFIDSDDWAEHDLIERLINKVNGFKYEIIYCDYTTVHNDTSKNKVIIRNNVNWKDDDLDKIKKALIIAPSPIWSALYSASFFKVLNLKFPVGLFYEDNFLVPLLVCNAERISKVDKVLMNYNMTNISVTRSFNNERFFDRIKTAQLLLDEINLYKDFKYFNEIEFYLTEIFLINTSIGCYRKFYPVRHDVSESVLKDFEVLMPNFRKNKYFVNKVNKKFTYSCYVNILLHQRWLLKYIYSFKNLFLFTFFKK